MSRCKGRCETPTLTPKKNYYTHYYCRFCSWWVQHEMFDDTKSKRCPCCSMKISTRPRNSQCKQKFRLIKE